MAYRSRLLTILKPKGFNPLSLNPTLWALPANSFSRTGGQFTAASSQSLSVATTPTLKTGDVDYWGSMWVNPTTLGAENVVFARFSTEFAITLRSYQTVYTIRTDAFPVTGTGALATGSWSFLFWFHDAATKTIGLFVNGTLYATTYTGTHGSNDQTTYIGRRDTDGYYDGLMDNVLFGKPPTSLGDGTEGSLAYEIESALRNSGNGLPFQSITAQQQSDWGIVSGWLDNSLTADAFGSNTLTNNNGVTQAAGKVNAVAVDNDPVYFVNDASANNNDLTQVTLANRPFYKSADGGYWQFDGTDDYLEKSGVGVIPYPFALYSVFKADTTTGAKTLISYGTTAASNEVALLIVNGTLWGLSGGSWSQIAFTDTSNYHYASAVFESETSRTIYLDGTAGAENTASVALNFTGSHIRIGRRGGATQNFDGNIAFTCVVPDWTLDKQQSLDAWVQSEFGL